MRSYDDENEDFWIKYEFTGEEKEILDSDGNPILVRRIRSLRNFDAGDYFRNVCIGEEGGWIQNYYNLDMDGGAWVFDEAVVCDKAVVGDNAAVYGNAMVKDNAGVAECAEVGDNCLIEGNAKVGGHASVSEKAVVRDHARVAGNAVLSENCCIEGNAIVGGDAKIKDDAIIKEHAIVYEKAIVEGDADISGHATIRGEACVRNGARLFSDVCWLIVGPDRKSRFTTFYRTSEYLVESKVMVARRDFKGAMTLEEFTKWISCKCDSDNELREFYAMINLARTKLMYSDITASRLLRKIYDEYEKENGEPHHFQKEYQVTFSDAEELKLLIDDLESGDSGGELDCELSDEIRGLITEAKKYLGFDA